MDIRAELFARHHGLVRTSELLAIGDHSEMIRWRGTYRAAIRVRRGWWALPSTPVTLIRAWEAGGRLACISALAFHGEILDVESVLHIEIPEGSRRRAAAGVVVHWARNQRNGDRRAVSVEVVRRQANRCRAANGSL